MSKSCLDYTSYKHFIFTAIKVCLRFTLTDVQWVSLRTQNKNIIISGHMSQTLVNKLTYLKHESTKIDIDWAKRRLGWTVKHNPGVSIKTVFYFSHSHLNQDNSRSVWIVCLQPNTVTVLKQWNLVQKCYLNCWIPYISLIFGLKYEL
jgi:hypothetical protein